MQDSTPEIVIRPARPEDADRAAEITAEVFAPGSMDRLIAERFGGADWRDIKGEEVRQEFRDRPGDCFVAEIDGRMAGYVTTVISQVASRGRIVNLAVEAGRQGLGIGRQLLERALDHFRSLDLQQAKIETLAVNDAGRHLYPSLGFQEIVRQIHFAMPLK